MIIFGYGWILGGHFFSFFSSHFYRHMACNMKRSIINSYGIMNHYKIILVEFHETIEKVRIKSTIIRNTHISQQGLHFVSDSRVLVILLVIQTLFRGKDKKVILFNKIPLMPGNCACVVYSSHPIRLHDTVKLRKLNLYLYTYIFMHILESCCYQKS